MGRRNRRTLAERTSLTLSDDARTLIRNATDADLDRLFANVLPHSLTASGAVKMQAIVDEQARRARLAAFRAEAIGPDKPCEVCGAPAEVVEGDALCDDCRDELRAQWKAEGGEVGSAGESDAREMASDLAAMYYPRDIDPCERCGEFAAEGPAGLCGGCVEATEAEMLREAADAAAEAAEYAADQRRQGLGPLGPSPDEFAALLGAA